MRRAILILATLMLFPVVPGGASAVLASHQNSCQTWYGATDGNGHCTHFEVGKTRMRTRMLCANTQYGMYYYGAKKPINTNSSTLYTGHCYANKSGLVALVYAS